jgi:uncharacterized protein YbjT (DUF2867 family)
MPKSILILGASGLIGNEVLKLSIENSEIENVTIIVRKSLKFKHSKLNEVVTDFKNLTDLESIIKGDAIICCLGTTRKKTPNQEKYRTIDLDLTVDLARIAKQQNVPQIHLISAVGADSRSKIFYNRLKGETEEAIIILQFDQTIIYRPSLLIGKRVEFRFGELLAQKLAPLFDLLLFGSLSKYHSISSNKVAKAILKRALSEGDKIEIKEYAEMQLLQQ